MLALALAAAGATGAAAAPLDVAGARAASRIATRDGSRRTRRLPARTALVAVIAGALAAGLAARAGWTWALPAELALVAGSVPLAACDAEWLLLPRSTVWTCLAAVTAAALVAGTATGDWHRAVTAAEVGGTAFATFAALSLANPRWMGFGDVRLAAPVGVAVGLVGGFPLALGWLLVTNVLAAAVGVVLVATRRARAGRALPYGVFMAAGAGVTLLMAR